MPHGSAHGVRQRLALKAAHGSAPEARAESGLAASDGELRSKRAAALPSESAPFCAAKCREYTLKKGAEKKAWQIF